MCGECEMLNDACWLGKIIPRKIFKRTLRTIYLCSLWIRAFIAFARRQSWSLLDSLRKCMPPMAHAGIVLFCYPSEFIFRNRLSLLQSWQGYCPQLMLLFIQSGSCGLSGGWMVCYPGWMVWRMNGYVLEQSHYRKYAVSFFLRPLVRALFSPGLLRHRTLNDLKHIV